MMEPLVSIITCCYNGERFIERWADSLLKQTYGNVEILFVDDGSEDNSAGRAMEFKEAFEKKGFLFKYFRQENQGIGGATNVGLLHMTGDYFMIYDIDDILYPNCLQMRVKYLEENTDCSMVLTNGHYAYEGSIENKFPIEYYSANITSMQKEKEWIFEDIILGKRVCSTCPYMHRTKNYLAANPDRTIYPTKYQQDTQITMISAFGGMCGYIDENLYAVISRGDSHSHSMKRDHKIDERLAYKRSTKEAKFATLDILPIDDVRKMKYKLAIDNAYMKIVDNVMVMVKKNERDYDVLPKKIVIFGAGVVGVKVFEMAKQLNLEVECFIDNNSAKNGKMIEETEIKSIADFYSDSLKNKYIIIASKHKVDAIHDQLEHLELKYGIDFCHYQDFADMCRETLLYKLAMVNSL